MYQEIRPVWLGLAHFTRGGRGEPSAAGERAIRVEGGVPLISESQVGGCGKSCSRFVPAFRPGKVGPPKTLQDLRRAAGAVRVTCRACKTAKQYHLQELIIDRCFRRLSMEWEAVRHGMQCHQCGANLTRVDGVPFGQDDVERRARRSRALLTNLAVAVLDDASRCARYEDVCVPATRLALRVLRPYLPDRELLVTFWTAAETGRGKPRSPALQTMKWIVTKLVNAGHPVWAEFR